MLNFLELEKLRQTDPSKALENVISGFRMKAASWRYEREYRQFIALRECEPSGRDYYRPFPAERMASVVLGARCSIRPVDVSRSLHYAGFPAADIVLSARMHRSQYQIVVD